ncbi:enhancer of polycomb homolog 1 isoform X1 [Neodiprion pinetum]|uniref:enhancer of polycomb homolog 1 isoform X1 n=1 Tax=Neodiprion pinetum TaxID=441929 RepID=UPI001EDEE1BA|nr:enhancer of polycomb homolog 1 isoform X1 [Neodiprion pinetum]
MSKLSFRARALDASKPMPIYMAEELPDLPDYSAINRAVPQMPSGMEKEEECEHHLQRAICTGLIIPTPEVTDMADVEAYDKIYPADYKLPRQLIHMQPFAMEQDIPDYDMDSEDEKWVGAQSRKMDLTPLQFEEMMDRLEKSSGQTVVTLNEAKALLKEDDDLIIAVFDYWLNKRLKTQHPLLLTVRTEHRIGLAANNPYLAFRRRTEKMQTRKNRKNDETSYEKMIKLRRDLSRAVTLLELVKRREKTKREYLHLTIEVYEKRYQAQDFSGQVLAEVSALKASRPAFAPLFANQFGVHQNWANKVSGKEEVVPRKEKRQYKKRKHKADGRGTGGSVGSVGGADDGLLRNSSVAGRGGRSGVPGSGLDPLASSDDDGPHPCHSQLSLPSDRDEEDTIDEGQFAFRRNKNCTYLSPIPGGFGNWPWCERSEGGSADKRYRFAPTSISRPTHLCVGLARRRVGRGGRIILDRCTTNTDDVWSSLDFTIHEPEREFLDTTEPGKKDWLHFRPKTPPPSGDGTSSEESSDSESEGEMRRDVLPPFPFPPEATSICIDVETSSKAGTTTTTTPGVLGTVVDEPPFTTEFNISDYFPLEFFSDFDVAVLGYGASAGCRSSATIGGGSGKGKQTDNSESDQRTDNQLIGCSRFLITPLIGNLMSHPSQQARSQCTSSNSSSSSSCSSNCSGSSSNNNSGGGTCHILVTGSSVVPTAAAASTTTAAPATATVTATTTVNVAATVQNRWTLSSGLVNAISQATTSSSGTVATESRANVQTNRHSRHHRQPSINHNSPAAAPILSKSLTSPTNNRSIGASSGITNFGNGHQNGPMTALSYHHNSNLNNLPNSTHHPVNNQTSGTINATSISSTTLPTTTTFLSHNKHQPQSILASGIAQSKLASISRQQQQQQQQQQQHAQNQAQQIPTPGEITLNSNR